MEPTNILRITVDLPRKVGSGRKAHTRYRVTTTVFATGCTNDIIVFRRFREFLALYETLRPVAASHGIELPKDAFKDKIYFGRFKKEKVEFRQLKFGEFLEFLRSHSFWQSPTACEQDSPFLEFLGVLDDDSEIETVRQRRASKADALEKAYEFSMKHSLQQQQQQPPSSVGTDEACAAEKI